MRVMLRALTLGALAGSCVAMPVLADDPRDPAMRSRAAREADAAEIRRLNRAQAAYVQRRDARYAEGWQEWREAEGGALDRETARQASEDQDRYADARAEYEQEMAEWRRDVSACRAGYYGHCAR